MKPTVNNATWLMCGWPASLHPHLGPTVFYHIILWEWNTNHSKKKKTAENEHPWISRLFWVVTRVPQGTPGYPSFESTWWPIAIAPSRRAWLGLRRAGPDGEDPIGRLWEESYYGSLSRWRPKHWSKNTAFSAICHRSRMFFSKKISFTTCQLPFSTLFNTF